VRPDRRGFTLFEVAIALVVGALVVTVAHAVFAGVADGGQALAAARQRLDREMNARRWLRATFLSLDVGTDSAGGFAGHPTQVEFAAWARTPDDWFERRRMTLARDGDRLIATATATASPPIALQDSVQAVAFDYLLEPGLDARWVREWVSPVSAPLAVRLRLTTVAGRVDTLLFLIKARG
jgi:prepilin-type N-terminal cleavage/methylation domain-containing protein